MDGASWPAARRFRRPCPCPYLFPCPCPYPCPCRRPCHRHRRPCPCRPCPAAGLQNGRGGNDEQRHRAARDNTLEELAPSRGDQIENFTHGIVFAHCFVPFRKDEVLNQQAGGRSTGEFCNWA